VLVFISSTLVHLDNYQNLFTNWCTIGYSQKQF